jgi:hypothetical protein
MAERYRRTARKLRTLAAAMTEDEGRAALLRAADGYDEMARDAESMPADDADDKDPGKPRKPS